MKDLRPFEKLRRTYTDYATFGVIMVFGIPVVALCFIVSLPFAAAGWVIERVDRMFP